MTINILYTQIYFFYDFLPGKTVLLKTQNGQNCDRKFLVESVKIFFLPYTLSYFYLIRCSK